MTNLFRRVRGAIGNAVVWGLAWCAGTFALLGTLHLTGFASFPFWAFAIPAAKALAVMGFLSGGAFSVYLSFAGRRKSLSQLSAPLFGLGGGVIGATAVPIIAFGGAVLLGGGVPPIQLLALVGTLGGGFGAATAYGTIRIAQGALTSGEVDAPELLP